MSKGYHDYFLSFSQSSLDKEGRSNSYFSPDSRLVHPLFSHSSYVDKLTMLHHILNNKIHGISFSPYLDGQSPGVAISAKQITDRLSILTPHTDWIRTFSCVDGNEQAPGIAKAQGLKTMVGVEIGSDKDKNDIEINNAIKLAKAGYADILVIGNEVLLRGDLKVEELLDYIHRVKAALPEQLVSYVDAYFLFENYPSIVQALYKLVMCYWLIATLSGKKLRPNMLYTICKICISEHLILQTVKKSLLVKLAGQLLARLLDKLYQVMKMH